MDFTDKEKYAIITILSLIMEADTIVHPKEIEFMNTIMRRLDIRISDLDHMEMKDLTLSKTIIQAMPLQKQKIVKEWFLTMAQVDGYIDPRETKVINSTLGL